MTDIKPRIADLCDTRLLSTRYIDYTGRTVSEEKIKKFLKNTVRSADFLRYII